MLNTNNRRNNKMTMNTRTATRQRYPDLGKELTIIRSYENYAKFEMELNEPGHIFNGSVNYTQRIQELLQESSKTLEALKEKQPVRIPELSGPKTTSNNVDASINLLKEIKSKQLKKHVYKRTGKYVRYNVIPNPEDNKQYDYEATKKNIDFISKLSGPQFTVEEFERLINLFEKENYKADNKIILFPSFVIRAEGELMRKNEEGVKQIYDYWNKIRSGTVHNSLMRKYWRPADTNNNDPRVIFRSSKDEKHNLRRNRKYDEEYLKKVRMSIKFR